MDKCNVAAETVKCQLDFFLPPPALKCLQLKFSSGNLLRLLETSANK